MTNRLSRAIAAALAALVAFGSAAADVHLKPEGSVRWYKGVTHFHTLWSDGNCAPEVAVKWYLDNGYDFISITDHNILATGEKWVLVSEDPRASLTPERVQLLKTTFGEDWLELREQNGRQEMRLKTLNELVDAFCTPGAFLVIPGEEVSALHDVHINAVNIRDRIVPTGGETPEQILHSNYQLIEAHAAEHGLNTLIHINHPNFSSHITAEEIVSLGGERFFEVYNGHGGVRNWGDEQRHIVSTDKLWDIILSLRYQDGDTDKPMYAVATDDAHEWFERGAGGSIPGRGWVMVLADTLDTDPLISAMKAGHFYATSGVLLDEVHADTGTYSVHIRPEEGVSYTTQFFGSDKDASIGSEPIRDAEGNELRATRRYSDSIGNVLLETTDNPAVYPISGRERYVRAKVVSSKLKENPFRAGDHETAWTQPARIP